LTIVRSVAEVRLPAVMPVGAKIRIPLGTSPVTGSGVVLVPVLLTRLSVDAWNDPPFALKMIRLACTVTTGVVT
jgi:hypothetical protein